MIIYNVTCNLSAEMEKEWVHWMKQVHIPEVIATKKFTGFRMMKLLTSVNDNEGVNYAVQYYCDSMNDYNTYIEKFAPAIRQKTLDRYGESVLAFRTLMEEV